MQGLVAGDIRHRDDLILIEELLSLPNSAAELNLSPQKKREKVFESLMWQLEAIARRTPVLFVFEDAPDRISAKTYEILYTKLAPVEKK